MPRICVNSQTPLVKFDPSSPVPQHTASSHEILDIHSLVEGKDFEFSPGGVTRMVYPLLKQMMKRKTIEDAHWISLNSFAPARVLLDGITLHHVLLEKEKMKGYGYTKEVIWNVLHGTGQEATTPERLLWEDQYPDFVYYNRLTAERISQLDGEYDFDLFYIHDFQQLPIGHMLRTPKPCLFRWHIPFDETMVPRVWKEFLSKYLDSYDAVVVSCRKYLESLRIFGFTGMARVVRPFIDPSEYTKPTSAQVEELCHRFDFEDSDRIILTVARLDPMKGQDMAIRAMAKVADRVPEAKLLLVGNGSFSGSRGGPGSNKAERWLGELRCLAKELKVERNVIFAGHLNQAQLCAAYERCEMTVLPSIREGFGLVVVESWLFGKPALVSSRAGIAEMVDDGTNGIIFEPDDSSALGDKIMSLLNNPTRAETLGENGFSSSKGCLIEQGVDAESEVILELLGQG